jgi:hypothetical protein
MLPRQRETADRRVIGRILQLSHGQSNPSENTITLISLLFEKSGGSWVEFFTGDPSYVKHLKRCVSVVVKKEREMNEQRRK